MKKITFLNVRYFLILLTLAFLPSLVNAQTHFVPATNNGTGNWHFYPVTSKLDGVDLVKDDEIAIYDGSICVGARVLTGPLDGSYGMAVANDWISYEESNSGGDGYVGGHSYTWKCWDKSANQEYSGTMTYNTDYDPQDYTGNVFPATFNYRWSWVDLTFTATVPQTGDLVGTITESVGGDPVENVQVTAKGNSTYVTTTNATGDYLFDEITIGTYKVVIEHTDFISDSVSNIVVTDGGTTTQNFSFVYKKGNFKGYVKDNSGAAIENATVKIGTYASVTTNASGYFEVTNIAPETYSAYAEKTGFARVTANNLRIGPDSTTNHNFTLNTSGTLSGIITDGTNTGTEDGVKVKVIGTNDSTLTAGGGVFSFVITPGTYSIEISKNGFHTSTFSGFVVTAGETTDASENIYEEHYKGSMGDGNPYSDVWTIYLNTVTGDGSPLKVGDEIGIYTNASGINASIARSKGGDAVAVTTANGGTAINIHSVAHGLVNGDEIEIYNSTSANGAGYDGIGYKPITKVDDDNFTVIIVYDGDETVDWQDKKITVTSSNHRLSAADHVTISGSADYNATYTNITNVTTNTFDLDTPFVRAGAATWGNWTKVASDLVGYFALTEPISNAGTEFALTAFTEIYNKVGYKDTDKYTFKLWLGGGSAEYDLTAGTGIDWKTGTGLTVPTAYFPSGNPYSKVDLDFDTPDGGLIPTITRDGGGVGSTIESGLSLMLKKADGTKQDSTTYDASTSTNNDFKDNVPAGTYSLFVSGDRVVDTTYTDIVVTSGVNTTKSYKIRRNTVETQTISLTAGYNLVSKRVHADNQTFVNFLGSTCSPVVDVSTASNIDFIHNNINQTKYFSGTVSGPDFNWNTKEGYQFKMNANETVSIPSSTPMSYNAEITVAHGGYTMIAYLPSYNLDASTAFASLKTADLVYIRDTDGNSLTKIGGNWVDHIGICTPGEGFLVSYGGTASVTFTYPAETKSVLNGNEDLQPVHFPFYAGYGNPTNAIYTMYVSGSILEYGDEIAVYDGSNIVGAKVIQSEDQYGNNLVAFTELFDKEGYTPGNKIVLKLWKASEDKEYWVNYTNKNSDNGQYSYVGSTFPSGDAKYSEVELAMSPLSVNDNLTEYINLYPNPANNMLNISAPFEIDNIVIVNILGQQVLNTDATKGITELNVSNLDSGIYFVNMIIDGQKITKKLSIQ